MDVKTTFLNGSLEETIYMVQSEGSLKRAWNRKCASYRNLFVDLSRHQGLGTSRLIYGSNQLDLSNVLMNPVCTRDATETWWRFLVIHEDDIPIIRNNNGKIISSK